MFRKGVMQKISKQEFIKNYSDAFNKLPIDYQNAEHSAFHIEYDELGNAISTRLDVSFDVVYYDFIGNNNWYNLSL